MERLYGPVKHHDWGSNHLIPRFVGAPEDGRPWAEQWFGAHPLGPSKRGSTDLRQEIASDPVGNLGTSTRLTFGDELPYLVKLIAPARALSLQVHPGSAAAAQGFSREERLGIPRGSQSRAFQDTTHKPEMLYALTEFEALVGFCVRRQAARRLEGLSGTLATRLGRRLRLAAGRGLRPVVSWILDPEEAPSAADVQEFSLSCAERLAAGASPEPAVDRTIGRLQEQFPGDPTIIVAFLMNHLRLAPGETLFIPTRTVHSYQHGLGLEVMANSDNVIRAGLTSKSIDAGLFLDTASFSGLPPTRIAPEQPETGVALFRSPVEDFELVVATPRAPGAKSPLPLPGTGPRTLVGLGGTVTAITRSGELEIRRGEGVFVPDRDGPLLVTGEGKVAQVSVP